MSVSRTRNSSRGHSPPIAVIGMECIFPKAENLARYWDNIVREIDCITDIPPSRWRMDDYFDPDPRTPDKTYCKRGGFIPEIDFDPTEFGLPPNILEVTDVSQLLALVVARRAMEDAGYGNGRQFDRDRVGVILGVGVGQKLLVPLISRIQDPVWRKALKSSGVADGDADQIINKIKSAYIPWAEDSFPGLLSNVIAGRIASRLNLGGTNCVVDAACASSLAAAKLAISDLEQGRSDMVITGGVDTDNSPFMYMCFSKTPALTPNSHARPFDADSDGILIGEGLGMLVLKRLEDARSDGDRVYAVIRGIGSSSDGRSKSIYAPRVAGQVMALNRAYEDAGIAPETVSLIEAHGTGTRAGDVCEVEALSKVFAKAEPLRTALGSVKSQIGHTKAAAGSAGLIKTCLALHHKVLPPTLNIESPSPKLEPDTSPLYLNTRARPWLRSTDDSPRRAGVSSFGFGGTNFHFVLEEYGPESDESFSLRRAPYTVLLFAENKSELAGRCRSALAGLRSDNGEVALAALAQSCRSVEIPAPAARIGFVAARAAEACELLQTVVERLEADSGTDWEYQGISFRSRAIADDARVVALFPGQGSQYVEMGRELACSFPVVRRAWQAANDLSDEVAPSQVVFPAPVFDAAGRRRQADKLQRTEHAQPAIGAFSMGLYKLLRKAGFQADMVAGHSFGELTALWAAGVFGDSEFLAFAQLRGKAMTSPGGDSGFDAGAMLAVQAGVARVKTALTGIGEVTIANDNSENQVVLAGPTGAIEAAREALEAQNISSVLLPVSAAFHTPLVAHASQPFAEALSSATFHSPQIPVYSNASAKAYPKHHRSIRKILREHILSPVRFREEIEQLYADGGYCFVEFGPKSVLTGLVNQILQDRPHLAIALNPKAEGDSERQLREAVVKLRVAGLPLTDLEPQGSPKPAPAREKKMKIRLGGNNYVSQKTRDRYEEAMSNGHRVRTVAAQPENNGQNSPAEAAYNTQAASGVVISKPASAQQPTNQPTGELITSTQLPKSPAPLDAEKQGQLLQSIERSLTQFYSLQADTLRVHEQYLRGQMEYSRTFFQLMQQQYALLGQGALPPTVMNVDLPVPSAPVQPEGPREAPVAMAPPIQAANPPTTPRADVFQPPAPAPAPQDHYALPVVQPLAQSAQLPDKPPGNGTGPSPAAKTVAESAPAPAEEISTETLTRSMLKIVSERTGYPEDMLDMEMHIEADLGIDSIKRVEILGAMVDAHPDLPKVSPDDLAELQTFGQIVDFMQSKAEA